MKCLKDTLCSQVVGKWGEGEYQINIDNKLNRDVLVMDEGTTGRTKISGGSGGSLNCKYILMKVDNPGIGEYQKVIMVVVVMEELQYIQIRKHQTVNKVLNQKLILIYDQIMV